MLRSRVAKEILKDQGSPARLGPDEQWNSASMDFVDRESWPEGEELIEDTNLTTIQGPLQGRPKRCTWKPHARLDE